MVLLRWDDDVTPLKPGTISSTVDSIRMAGAITSGATAVALLPVSPLIISTRSLRPVVLSTTSNDVATISRTFPDGRMHGWFAVRSRRKERLSHAIVD